MLKFVASWREVRVGWGPLSYGWCLVEGWRTAPLTCEVWPDFGSRKKKGEEGRGDVEKGW